MKQIRYQRKFALIIIISCLMYLMLQDAFAKENILAIAVSPDGIYNAVSSQESVIISKKEDRMSVNVKHVTSLAFSPDGKWLAGGSYRKIYVWDTETGRENVSFPAHENYVTSLEFSPDSLVLASGSKGNDKTIKLWNPNTGRQKNISMRWDYQYSDKVRALAFSPDGNLLASASLDRNIPVRIWDTKTGNIFHELKIKKGAVLDVAFSPGGEFLVSGMDDGNIMIYETTSGRVMKRKEHISSVVSLGFTLNENYLVTGGKDSSLIYWDIRKWNKVDTYELPGSLQSFKVLPETGIAAGIKRGELFLYALPDESKPAIYVTSSPEIQKASDRDIRIRSKNITGIIEDESDIREVMINGEKAYLSIPTPDERSEYVDDYRIRGRVISFSGDINVQTADNIIEIIAVDSKGNKEIKRISLKTAPDHGFENTAGNGVLPNWYERQYALVIGLDNYRSSGIDTLQNAVNDAKEIAFVLKDMGFEVNELYKACSDKAINIQQNR